MLQIDIFFFRKYQRWLLYAGSERGLYQGIRSCVFRYENDGKRCNFQI